MTDSEVDSSVDELDRQLRRALEPPAGSGQRVVRRALEQPMEGWKRQRPAAWSLAALVAVAAVVVVLALLRGGAPPQPRETAQATRAPTIMTITNRSGVVTLETPGGTATLVVHSQW